MVPEGDGGLRASELDIPYLYDKISLLFRVQGLTGERFADTVERIGFENVQEQLLSDGLLQRKEENLKLNVKGGATC